MDLDTIVRFVLLGLGIGALYGVVAQGIVLVYRGSGVLNFAQGAFVMVGAYVYYELIDRRDVPPVLGVLIAPFVGAVVGAATYRFVLRPMRYSSPLSRVIATLAVLIVIQAVAVLRYGVDTLGVKSWLPTRTVEVISGAPVGLDRLIILGIGVALTLALTAVYRYTAFGRITTAVAENERTAASLGHSPDRIATANWALGAALAALVGALLAPITFLQPTNLVMLVVPGLAAALIGRFQSFGLAFAGAAAIGVSESLMARYVATPGWSQSVPFLAVIAVLVLRGTSLPLRSHVLDRLPEAGSGRVPLVPVAITVGIATVLLTLVLGVRWGDAFTVTMVFGILCLSVVVVTGYAGQLSLAQYVIAGLGAFTAAKVSHEWDVPFLLALVLGVVTAAVIGTLVGLPSLRTRGINLAIATLGLAIVGFALVLSNYEYTGGTSG
ncbi:MAG TPA: ABC transporter permease, partial [Agromyces sp.]